MRLKVSRLETFGLPMRNYSFKQVEPSKTVNTRIKYAAAYSLLTSLTPLQN